MRADDMRMPEIVTVMEGTRVVPIGEMMERVLDISRQDYAKGGQPAPVFTAQNAANDLIIIVTPWGDEREKRAMTYAVKALFRQQDVRRYVFVCECWWAQYTTKELEDPDVVPPSERPDAQDILMIVGVEKGAPPLVRVWPVKDGRLGQEFGQDHTGFTGMMTGLLAD